MNDDLDTAPLDSLRSFRPEATGPTAALVTEGRNALMTSIDSERLPQPAPRRRLLGRRSVRVALVLATALVAVAGVAAATGLIPDDVRQSLGLASNFDSALAPKTDDAVKRATAANPDGGTVELWTAPTNGGGDCAYLRHLDASGTPTDARRVTCGVSLGDGRRVEGISQSVGGHNGGGGSVSVGGAQGGLTALMDWSAGDPLTVYGQAPAGATEVAVEHADGTVTKAPVVDGWWLAVFAGGTDHESLAGIEARSASGATLGSAPLETVLSGTAPPGSGVVTQSTGS